MTRKIQVGAIPYLNGKPLIEGYDSLRDSADFQFHRPSRLAELMAVDEIDIGLVSCVEYLRGKYAILPDVGVVSRGAVNSVLLTGCRPVDEAETVNLDPSSLTSCTLTALWYRLKLEQDPVFSRYPIGSPEALACDAQLAIGDEGLFRSGQSGYQVDLGEAWKEWIGYPFVYAAWLVRREVVLGRVGAFLRNAARKAPRPLRELAEEASRRLGLDTSLCLEYLTHSLQFSLDQEAITGLEIFLNMAAENAPWLSRIIEGFPPVNLPMPVHVEFHDEACPISNMEP